MQNLGVILEKENAKMFIFVCRILLQTRQRILPAILVQFLSSEFVRIL